VYGQDSVADVLDSDSLREFRKQFEREEQPIACSNCWIPERFGNGDSKRQIENKRFAAPVRHIRTLDIKPGNVCNLKCRICSSYASSRWISDEIKLSGKSHFPLYDWPERYGFTDLHQLAENLEYIEISGGEPFMLGTQWEFIEWLKDNNYHRNIHLQYHTNGTLYSDKWIENLMGFKKVQLSLSIDGIGPQFEYLRHPAEWDTVLDNWHKYKSNPELSVSISHSINALNVLYIGEFARFAKEMETEVYWNVVENVMPVESLTSTQLSHLITSLTMTLPTDTSGQVNPLSPGVNWLYRRWFSTAQSNVGNANLDLPILEQISRIDQLRNESYAETFPDMHWILTNV